MITSISEKWIGRGLLVLLMILTVLPLISMLSAALAKDGTFPSGLTFPSHPHFGNFITAFKSADFLKLLASSLLIAVGVVPVTLLLSALAGFAMGPLRAPGRTIVLLLLLFGLSIPVESTVTPLYYQMQGYGVLNTRWAIILPLIGLFVPFSTLWMRTHFLSVPNEINEAARLDGTNTWKLFTRIHLPIAKAPLSSLALLIFLWSINSFLIPLVMETDPGNRTLAGALGAFQGQYTYDPVLLNAGALLIALPALILFLAFQRSFINGLTEGAVN